MATTIIYVSEFPGLARTDQSDSVQVFPVPQSGQQAILATVGGGLTFTITSGGSALTSGTYTDVAINNIVSTGTGGTVRVGVSSTGIVTVLTPFRPGYSYKIGDTFSVANSVIGTPSSVLTTFTVLTVLPCSAPFNPATKFVELSADVNGPAYLVIDSTLTSTGFNGVLTTQQATLVGSSNRITSSERIARGVPIQPTGVGVNPACLPVGGAGLQVIMGTAAA